MQYQKEKRSFTNLYIMKLYLNDFILDITNINLHNVISHITKETFISIHIVNTSEKNHHWCLTIIKYKQHFDVAYQISLSRKSLL